MRYKPLAARHIAAEAYQVIGALSSELPATAEIVRVLDYFSAVSCGKTPKEEMLPFLCDWEQHPQLNHLNLLEYKLKTIILHSTDMRIVFDDDYQITLKSNHYIECSDQVPYQSGWFNSIDEAATQVIKDMNIGITKLFGESCKLFKLDN